MTRQQLFNQAATVLLTQGERSRAVDDTCLYRGPNGLKCAIGAMIPDALYEGDIEGYNIERLLDDYPAICKVLGGQRNVRFLDALQVLHDSVEPTDWLESLEDFALQYDLSTKVLEPFRKI
jgi:hypothetical protein